MVSRPSEESPQFDSLAGKLDRAWRGSTLELPHQEGSLALLMKDPDGLWNGSSVHE